MSKRKQDTRQQQQQQQQKEEKNVGGNFFPYQQLLQTDRQARVLFWGGQGSEREEEKRESEIYL